MPTTVVPTVVRPIASDLDHARIARAAAIRAESIRQQLARTGDTLEPLRAAWRRRAAELELAASALWPEVPATAALGRTA